MSIIQSRRHEVTEWLKLVRTAGRNAMSRRTAGSTNQKSKNNGQKRTILLESFTSVV